MVAKKQTKSSPAPTATVINRQPAGTPSTQDELAQAKARVVELERNQKQASIAEAEKAIAPAKAAYEKAIAEGQAAITAARRGDDGGHRDLQQGQSRSEASPGQWWRWRSWPPGQTQRGRLSPLALTSTNWLVRRRPMRSWLCSASPAMR